MDIGNGQTMSESRQHRVQAGLAAVAEVEHERDACQEALANLQTEYRGLRAEHDALSIAYERAQNDITTWRQDRDEAVSKLAAFQAVFEAVLAVMQKHRDANLSVNVPNRKVRSMSEPPTSG